MVGYGSALRRVDLLISWDSRSTLRIVYSGVDIETVKVGGSLFTRYLVFRAIHNGAEVGKRRGAHFEATRLAITLHVAVLAASTHACPLRALTGMGTSLRAVARCGGCSPC